MINLLDNIFLGLIAIAIPVIMVGLIALIVYIVYRDVRDGRGR